jgi:hypothetical protein
MGQATAPPHGVSGSYPGPGGGGCTTVEDAQARQLLAAKHAELPDQAGDPVKNPVAAPG